MKCFLVFRDSPEYQPRQNNQDRVLRRYLINNSKGTEVHILQGDILQTKADAIVNGLSYSFKKRRYCHLFCLSSR